LTCFAAEDSGATFNGLFVGFIVKRATLLLSCCVVAAALPGDAQEPTSNGPRPVIIQRKALLLSSPERYRVPLQLLPVRGVILTAPYDGTVLTVSAKPGARAEAQFELAKIDSGRLKLTRARAIAALNLAETRLRQATVARNKISIDLAEAEVKLADADIKLADYDDRQTSIRAPYGGTVLDVFVQPGKKVKQGDPIASFGDLSQVRCRIPVERSKTTVGSTLMLNVESQSVPARVEAIVALTTELQVLRELSISVALADVVIDNPSGVLRDGQSVFAPLVPSEPVTRVPLEIVKTSPGGERTVQVLRAHIVRDIPVTLHGQDGKTAVFVSGPFTKHDELMLSTSVELADGTAVRPSSADRFATTTPTAETATTGGAGQPATTKKKKSTSAAGF
jgi:multidrug efflux pump subunit AcrA (membrane-fusion protein)